MNRTVEELETMVRERICSICDERTVEGACGKADPNECALFRLFPQVAQAILSVQSDRIGAYVQAIREKVCKVCVELPDGSCPPRDQIRCSLDAYLIPVVDVIEEATGRKFNRNELVLPVGGENPVIRIH